jgi:uncharacterized protein (TIGR03663 family)
MAGATSERQATTADALTHLGNPSDRLGGHRRVGRPARSTRAVAEPDGRTEEHGAIEAATTASGRSLLIHEGHPNLGPNPVEWLGVTFGWGLSRGQALLVIAFVIVAIITRFWNVGERAMHHDESMHAKFAWDTFRGNIYKYNPLLHGPFQFLSVAASFWLFGATETTARAVPAFFGVALVALTFLWRRWLGVTGWLISLGIFTLSPSFIYFSRMLREDSYTATWTLLAMTGFIGFVLLRRRAWYYTFCIGLSFAYATKESTFITMFLIGTFLLISIMWEHASLPLRRAIQVGAVGAIVGGFITAVVGLYKKELFEIGGGFIGLALGALVGVAYDRYKPENPDGLTARERGAKGTMTGAWRALWGDSTGFWGLGTFSGGIVLFSVIFIILFTSFFTNFGGIREGLIGGIRYWLEQHGVQRGNQPWFYYILIIASYETLPFVFFVLATIEYLRRPTWVTSFMLWWGWGALTIYSWAGEKMPWLVIHIVTPMVLLAARFLGEIWHREGGNQWYRGGSICVAAMLVGWSIHTGWPVNFERPDTPRDLLVYTQTAPDVKKVMADIERMSLEQTANSRDLGVTVQSGAWWPFSWYLRDFKNVDYPSQLNAPATKPVVIVALEDDDKNAPFLNGYAKTKYKMRWWYPEDYRNITLRSIRNVFTNAETRSGLWQWLIYREPTQPLGSYDFFVYVREGIPGAPVTGAASSGGAQTARINPEAYVSKAIPIQSRGEFGSTGKGQGQFTLPRGVATDGSGSFYVADTGNHRVQRFDRTGKVVVTWGTEGSGDGQFKEPMGVALDRDGNVYVADTWNHRVQKFDANGRFLAKWSGQNGGFWGPRSLVVDRDNNVFVTDTGNKRLQKFDSSGRFLAQIGQAGAGPAQLNEPIGLTLDTQGNIFVADTMNRRVQKLDPTGKYLAEFPIQGWQAGPRTEPYIAIDAQGYLFVTDPPNNRIVKMNPSGEVLAVVGTAGKASGQFDFPLGVAIDGNSLVVVDSGNGRIHTIGQP